VPVPYFPANPDGPFLSPAAAGSWFGLSETQGSLRVALG